jgi:hypothetical protein
MQSFPLSLNERIRRDFNTTVKSVVRFSQFSMTTLVLQQSVTMKRVTALPVRCGFLGGLSRKKSQTTAKRSRAYWKACVRNTGAQAREIRKVIFASDFNQKSAPLKSRKFSSNIHIIIIVCLTSGPVPVFVIRKHEAQVSRLRRD